MNQKKSKLRNAILETVEDMHTSGILEEKQYQEIILHLGIHKNDQEKK